MPLAAHDEAGRRHRAGDDAEHARRRPASRPCGGRSVPAAVRLLPGEVVVVLDAGEHARRRGARRRCAWITSWLAAAYSPIRFIARPVLLARSVSRSSQARCCSSGGSSGCSVARELASSAPRPARPGRASREWESSARYSPGCQPEVAARRASSTPNSTKWLPRAAGAELRRRPCRAGRAVIGVTLQSRPARRARRRSRSVGAGAELRLALQRALERDGWSSSVVGRRGRGRTASSGRRCRRRRRTG